VRQVTPGGYSPVAVAVLMVSTGAKSG
jgi:hypothetical protein